MARKSYVGLSLDGKIKDELKARAEKEHRTLSNMIEHGLTEWLGGNKSDLNVVAAIQQPIEQTE
ncbi:MAG: hypothetical protein M0R06_06895 [Sphaerochaeta sp.]|jgi:hypothetical protein|nr:hypothetical protein [Sphaerochaeta sp.]